MQYLEHTYPKNYFLFIWNSNLIGCPGIIIIIIVKSGNIRLRSWADIQKQAPNYPRKVSLAIGLNIS